MSSNANSAADKPRKTIDWERIEPEWRAGVKSVLQIAADYEKATGQKISHTAINKHFKGLGIPRDLRAKVQAKAEAMVSAAMVSGEVSTATTATDATIINTNAEIVAGVLLSQRKDIQRGRGLTVKLFTELEAQCDNPDLLEEIANEVIGPPSLDAAEEQRRRRRMDMFEKAISLSGRADTMKKLADTLKTLVGLEREAFHIKEEPTAQENALTDLLRQVNGSSLPLGKAQPADDEE